MAVNLKDLFENDTEERQVALFTAWMLVRAKEPQEVKKRLFGDGERNRGLIEKAFQVMVEQYAFFMHPLYRGQPPFVLYPMADDAFSERKQWKSLTSLGVEFKPPEDDKAA